MAKLVLFTDESAKDVSYINVRAAGDVHMQKARRNCEELWEIFEPHADAEFRIELRNNFDARYWEMYLTTFLIREGYEVTCPKPGPDVGIHYNGCRVWFEATCPTRGAEENADKVPDVKFVRLGGEPTVQTTPNEKLVLRYLNSISEKRRQYASWLENRVIAPEDAFVVAINPKRLRHEIADTDPPRILQTVYPVGPPYISLDPHTSQPVDVGYMFRDTIKRHSGAEVSTGIFLLDQYTNLSGLLCSRIDVANQPGKMGADFQLVENRRATAPLPDMFRLKGTFFRIEKSADGYVAIPEKHA